MDFIRPESLAGLFGDAYKKLPDDWHRAREALAKIIILLPLWMSGTPLNQLEAAYLARTDKLGRCEYARHFVSRIVPEIAFLAGLPARLLITRGKHNALPPALQTVLATLYQVSESVTLAGIPESVLKDDSRWRTEEVRHAHSASGRF
jgi:hypothetical protein